MTLIAMKRPQVWRLVGETVREIGILMLVFAPLEASFAERAINFSLLASVVTMAVWLIGAGIILETKE